MAGENLHGQGQLPAGVSHVEDFNLDSKKLIGIPFRDAPHALHTIHGPLYAGTK